MLELSRNFPGSQPDSELKRAGKLVWRASAAIPTGNLAFFLRQSFPGYLIWFLKGPYPIQEAVTKARLKPEPLN